MANSKLYWYNSVDLITKNPTNLHLQYDTLPGFHNYSKIHEFFAYNLSMTDRYGTTKLPIKTEIFDGCRAPEFKSQDLDYETICLNRARWFMDYAKSTNRKLFIMYSGGIDSSAIICSFFQACSLEEIRNHILVGLSEYSIKENPVLYRNFVLPYFEKVSSHRFISYLGHKDYITITGEGNDQLFGSAVIGDLIGAHGSDIISSPLNNDTLFKCFNTKVTEKSVCVNFVEVFNNAVKIAPVPIETVFHYFWWLNFQFKWQSVYMRVLSFMNKENALTLRPNDNYFTFFHTDEFQLWAMNNSDKLIRDKWISYKFTCKDLIYKLTKDENYRDRKAKYGSLIHLVSYKDLGKSINTDFEILYNHIDPSQWDNNNDFV